MLANTGLRSLAQQHLQCILHTTRGRVIGSYQAIKHKLADMYVKNELARSNAYYGAWALNTNAPELPVAASAARIAASEAYWFGSKENIQTHGGTPIEAKALQIGLVFFFEILQGFACEFFKAGDGICTIL